MMSLVDKFNAIPHHKHEALQTATAKLGQEHEKQWNYCCPYCGSNSAYIVKIMDNAQHNEDIGDLGPDTVDEYIRVITEQTIHLQNGGKATPPDLSVPMYCWQCNKTRQPDHNEKTTQSGMAFGIDGYNEAMGYDLQSPDPCGHQCSWDCPICGLDSY